MKFDYMKRFAVILGVMFLCAQTMATNLQLTLSWFGANPATNRLVSMQSMTPFPANLNWFTSDANGMIVWTNVPTGLINGVITAPPAKITFQVYITGPNLGTIDASNCTATGSATTYPAGQTAWTVATSDARYALSGTAGSNNFYPLYGNPSNYAPLTVVTGIVQSIAVGGGAPVAIYAGSGATVTSNQSGGFTNYTVSANQQTNGVVYTNDTTWFEPKGASKLATNGLGTAAFTASTSYDASGAALSATSHLGTAAFTLASAYDVSGAAALATNTPSLVRSNDLNSGTNSVALAAAAQILAATNPIAANILAATNGYKNSVFHGTNEYDLAGVGAAAAALATNPVPAWIQSQSTLNTNFTTNIINISTNYVTGNGTNAGSGNNPGGNAIGTIKIASGGNAAGTGQLGGNGGTVHIANGGDSLGGTGGSGGVVYLTSPGFSSPFPSTWGVTYAGSIYMADGAIFNGNLVGGTNLPLAGLQTGNLPYGILVPFATNSLNSSNIYGAALTTVTNIANSQTNGLASTAYVLSTASATNAGGLAVMTNYSTSVSNSLETAIGINNTANLTMTSNLIATASNVVITLTVPSTNGTAVGLTVVSNLNFGSNYGYETNTTLVIGVRGTGFGADGTLTNRSANTWTNPPCWSIVTNGMTSSFLSNNVAWETCVGGPFSSSWSPTGPGPSAPGMVSHMGLIQDNNGLYVLGKSANPNQNASINAAVNAASNSIVNGGIAFASTATTATTATNALALTNGCTLVSAATGNTTFYGTNLYLAYSNASDGDTILLGAATYISTTPGQSYFQVLKNHLTFKGTVKPSMVGGGVYVDSGPIVCTYFLNQGYDNTFDSIAFTNIGNNALENSATNPSEHRGHTIRNCLFQSNGHDCLIFGADNTIEDCFFLSNSVGYGLVIKGCSNTIASRITCFDVSPPIWVKADTTASVTNCTGTVIDSAKLLGSCGPIYVQTLGTNANLNGLVLKNITATSYNPAGEVYITSSSNCALGSVTVDGCVFNSAYIFDTAGLPANTITTNIHACNSVLLTNDSSGYSFLYNTYSGARMPQTAWTNLATWRGDALCNNGSAATPNPLGVSFAIPVINAIANNAGALPVSTLVGQQMPYNVARIWWMGGNDLANLKSSLRTNITCNWNMFSTNAGYLTNLITIYIETNNTTGYGGTWSQGIYTIGYEPFGTNSIICSTNYTVPYAILTNAVTVSWQVYNAGPTNYWMLDSMGTNAPPP